MAVGSLDSARLALDVKGLNGLKRAAVRDPDSQLKEVARKFEALFLNQMLKSMRKAGVQSDLIDGRQVRFYQSLLDQQLSQNLAGKGLGQADMLVRQLSGGARHDRAAGASDALATAAPARPQALGATPGRAASMDDVSGLIDSVQKAMAAATGASGVRAGEAGENVPSDGSIYDRFVRRFSGAAQAAARASGMPALLILAQAALETGWGRHEITADNGTGSHNLFGIKAGPDWSGSKAKNATHEYVDGARVSAREPFRVYASYTDAFVDHARLIGNSPRYSAVRQAGSPEQAAHALQAGGYATDPRYAEKLISIMHQIGDMASL